MYKALLFLSFICIIVTIYGQSNNEKAVKYLLSGDKKRLAKDYEGAILDFSRAILIDPKLSEAYRKRGDVYILQDQLIKAFSDHNNAIALDSTNYLAYIGRGYCNIYEKEDYSSGLKDLNKAILLNSKIEAEAYRYRAEAKGALGNSQGALSDINIAIEALDSASYEFYYFRANTKGWLGDDKGAVNDFTRSLEINPSFAKAYYFRGMNKAKLGDMEGACKDWKKAMDLGEIKAYSYILEYCK